VIDGGGAFRHKVEIAGAADKLGLDRNAMSVAALS